MSSFKAFTLLELVVIMGITAILSALGTGGIISLRQSVTLQNTAADLLSTMKNAENMARNSVPSRMLPTTTLLANRVDGYAVFVSGNNYSINYCLAVGDASGNYNCSGVEEGNIKPAQYNEISVAPPAADATRCRGIMFARRTGQIFAMSANTAVPSTSGICTFLLRPSIGNSLKTLQIDMANDSYALL